MNKIDGYIEYFLSGNSYFDKGYIKFFVEEYINNNELGKYLKGVLLTEFYEYSIDNLGVLYNYNSKVLDIDLSLIDKTFNTFLNNINVAYDDNTINRLYNMYVLLIIIKELNYVNQLKISTSSLDDSLTKLANNVTQLRIKKFNNKLSIREKFVYSFYYDYILSNRQATLASIDTILNSKETLIKEANIWLKKQYNTLLLLGYDKSSPLEEYLKLIGKKHFLDDSLNTNDYSLNTLALWGYPINKEKINSLLKK